MNISEHWSLFMKKKLKVTIELNGIGGMYTVKAKQQTKQETNKQKQQQQKKQL